MTYPHQFGTPLSGRAFKGKILLNPLTAPRLRHKRIVTLHAWLGALVWVPGLGQTKADCPGSTSPPIIDPV